MFDGGDAARPVQRTLHRNVPPGSFAWPSRESCCASCWNSASARAHSPAIPSNTSPTRSRRMRQTDGMQDVREMPDGRFISVSSRPMAGGGWVATHQDITERRRQDQERDTPGCPRAAPRDDRCGDRGLPSARRSDAETVGDNAGTMRATATTLFSASRQTSQRAEGAVHASNEASTNVEIAASAANELSASIDEISRQLGQTSNARRYRGRARPAPRTTRSARSRRPRRRSATWSSSSRTSPGRPICWRSMRRSRRPAPAKPDAASPWWPRR